VNLEVGSRAVLAQADWAKSLGSTHKMRIRVRLYATMLLLDAMAIGFAFSLANWIRLGDVFAGGGLKILTVLFPLYFGIAFSRANYGGMVFRAWRRASLNAAISLISAAAAVLFVTFYLHASSQLSRTIFTIGCCVSLAMLPALRWAVHRFGLRLMGQAPYAQVLICDGMEMECGPETVVINASVLGLTADIRDPGSLDRVGRLLSRADRVIIACAENRRATWAAVLKGANIQGEILTPELQAMGSLGAGVFHGEATLLVSLPSLNLRDRATKRAVDLAIASAALMLFGPLMILTALAIKLESRGPVFFVQSRLGRGNQLFRMYKFRSMHTEMCDVDGAASTRRGDKRVTRVGRIIRATSIDELPQLLNVVLGDMSIVGPRPHALGSLAGEQLFWDVDQRYWHRHATKPGITGLAQVRGLRGATHLRSDLIARLQADLDYLNGWSVWRDISILFATGRVIFHRNAY
jgi:polysaccharide biosynthesis protein PslA